MVNIEVEPKTLANWLQIAINQRKRTIAKATEEYGTDHLITDQLRQELNELQSTQTNCLKQATQTRLTKPTK